MNTDRRSFISAASPARSDTTSTGMPSGCRAAANASAPGPEARAGVPRPFLGHGPEQRDVGEPRTGDRRQLLLHGRRRRVEIGVDRVVAERRQRRLGGRDRGTRGVRAQHDVGARDRLLDRARRAAARGVGVIATNDGARRGEVAGEPASCLAQTEYRDLRHAHLAPLRVSPLAAEVKQDC